MKNSKRIILFAGLLVIIIAVLSGLYLFNKEHPDLTKLKPDFSITAEQLINEVETDELKASERYQDKILEVSGQVAHVNIADDSTVSVTLMNENQFAGVICALSREKELKEIPEIGDELLIRGTFSGILMDVILNNCVIIEKE